MAKVSISRAWDESRAVLTRDGKLIASVALALLVLPGVLVNVLLPEASDLGTPQAVMWTVVLFVAFLITFGGQLSIVRLAMAPHITVGAAIRNAIARMLPFIGAFFIWALPIVVLASVPYRMIRMNPASVPIAVPLALLALGLIGIFLAVRLMLVGPVSVAETGGSLHILKRSWNITSGNWWRLFGFFIVFGIGAIALIWATTAVVGLIARMTIGEISRGSVAALVVILIAQCVTSAVYAVLFVMQARIYVQLAGNEAQASVPSSGI